MVLVSSQRLDSEQRFHLASDSTNPLLALRARLRLLGFIEEFGIRWLVRRLSLSCL